MKNFLFFRGYTDKSIISQNEYNRRRDEMANELNCNVRDWETYQTNYYNQIRLAESQFKLVSKELNKSFFNKLINFFLNIFK